MIVFFRINTLTTVLLLLFCVTKINAQEKRIVIGLNDNWKFHRDGTEFADNPNFDDSRWQSITLPHTWNAADPFDDDETYFRGIGWYRKKINLDEKFRNKKLFIFFEGANQVADVYVNGAFAGRHKGGYTAFSIDITPWLNWNGNGENSIAVQVNNAHDNFIPPLSVGYALYGGIYRNTWLMATDELHFKEINNAAGSVFVSTPEINLQQANVNVKSIIINESEKRKTFTVLNSIMGANGNDVKNFSKEFSLAGNSDVAINISSGEINNPHLWSPEDPYLYTIRTQIISEGKIIDEVVNPLGFRWYSFKPGEGFFLNGKKYVLRGTNRHQDLEGKGSALTDEDHIRDMHLIKEMGANFLRLAHYPQAPLVLNLADQLGLLIWEEIPLVNYMNIDPEFLGNSENMLREMIHQHFNHPSIIMWGSMNEILLHSKEGDRIPKHTDTAYLSGVRKYAIKLDSLIRAEDPGRITTLAMHISGDYAKYGLDTISQVAGYNIYSGWYSGKAEDFGNDLDRLKVPGHNVFVSEYGAEGEVRLNTENPERFDYTGQYQRYYHETYLRQINQRPWLAGTAIWNQFDFSQPNIGGPQPHRNQKGMATWDRRTKDVYYLYKANWNPAPMVYIATRDWLMRSGEKNALSTIDVYSNAGEITLYVNGESQKTKKGNEVNKFSWQVRLKDGENIVRATGRINKKNISDEVIINYQAFNNNLTGLKSLSVNVGSNAQYKDAAGNIWIEDRPYQKGSFGYVSGKSKMFDRKDVIKGTDDEPVFYTYLDSVQAYRFDVADGAYSITLCFAEPDRLNKGDRIFDISINNKIVVNNLDLASGAGFAQALSKTFITEITNGDGINIKFIAKKGNPVLCGIKIYRQ